MSNVKVSVPGTVVPGKFLEETSRVNHASGADPSYTGELFHHRLRKGYCWQCQRDGNVKLRQKKTFHFPHEKHESSPVCLSSRDSSEKRPSESSTHIVALLWITMRHLQSSHKEKAYASTVVAMFM